MIYEKIDRLLSYGIITGLIEESDKIHARNRILTLLRLDTCKETGKKCNNVDKLKEILNSITDFVVKNGLIENDRKEGYFPMQDSYDEGGYEARSSNFKAGVGEYIIKEAKKLLSSLVK